MAPTLSYLCGLATMVFITTGLVVAAVRWGHMCRPYDRNPRYYYPGRPFVVGIYLCALALLPYALQPESPDAWFLARWYFLPVTLYHFTILLFAYFGNVMELKTWRLPMMIIGLPLLLSLIAAVVLVLVPGDQVSDVFNVVLFIFGGIGTGVCLVAMWIVMHWAASFDPDDFSNPADFPVVFARRWSVMIMVNVTLCWAGALAGSPALMAVIMLFFAGSSVLFIITALHPHRNRPVEEESAAEATAAAAVYNRAMPKKKRQEILNAIRTVVEQQEGYLDPHLTLQDVADRSGYNRSYISGIIKAEWGGFFTYVNRLRIAHVDSWLQEHPAGTIQEAVEASGFSSRQTYYAVKSRMAE